MNSTKNTPANNHNKNSFQDDINAINDSAGEMIKAFGKDTEIGKNYTRLAEAAEKANAALERFIKFGEEREAQRQV